MAKLGIKEMDNQETIKLMRDMAMDASQKAYSPYSKAKIGSTVLTVERKYFSGSNVENSSYGATICAERVAILKAVSNGFTKLSKIYVYSKDGWPPCGMCRQMISEFATNDLEIIIGDKEGNERVYKFTELFPEAFTPEHLRK